MDNGFKSGFICLIGRPNVGKSTLMNALVGEKVAIISDKPQTTRNTIRTILTGTDYQMVFIDTPGIHKPRHKLGEHMVKAAENSINEIDIVMYLVEPSASIGETDSIILSRLSAVKAPVILVINKIDTLARESILQVISAYQSRCNFKEIIPVSALKLENVQHLKDTLISLLQPGPMYFPDDMVTDQPERQLVAELVREKILRLLDEEVPHGIAVTVMSMKKRDNRELVDIEATIFCERETHKPILIGKGGSMLKKIGQNARIDIEGILGSPVNLQLWVKVKKDWRNSDFYVRQFSN